MSVVLETGCRLKDANLEAAVIFRDFVCEVDLFSLAQELSKLRPVIHSQVVTYKVSIETVSPPLLPVQQQVRCWINPGKESERQADRQTNRGVKMLLLSPSSLIWSYFLRARYFLQAFWMVLA